MALENTHLGAKRIGEILGTCQSIYFVGIGGINMSSLAHLTHVAGFCVGGSDRTESALTKRLEAEGIRIFYRHDGENLDGYDALVYTVAVGADNPEYQRAVAEGIPCFSRSDYMGYLMTEYQTRIGVSGTHGKSTCTSMCAEAMMAANADPTVLSGAELASMGGAYRVGGKGKKNFLFEACEYMDSFLDFNPTIAVILNVELDHVDYFPDLAAIRRSFGNFADRTGKNGLAVVNADDAEAWASVTAYEGTLLSFGIDSDCARVRAAELSEERGKYAFSVLCDGESYCRVRLSVSGKHNVYNALAAASVCYALGLDGESVGNALSAFRGARRRMEYRGQCGGAELYDDYAHHPTEIEATLKGARRMTEGRLFCVFQSHTYSRTHALFDDFAKVLRLADRVIIPPIYAARETDTLGVTPDGLARAVGEGAQGCADFAEAARILQNELCPGDVAVIMGAGDVWKVLEFIETEESK